MTLATESRDIVCQGAVSPSGPPTVDFKDVAVANDVVNCSTGRKQGVMDVLVDNVKVLRTL